MKAKFENLDLIDLEAAARQLVDDGKLSDAKECYLELLDRQPDWEAGLAEYELGLVHEELGEYREALRRYESAIARRPHTEGVRRHLVSKQIVCLTWYIILVHVKGSNKP